VRDQQAKLNKRMHRLIGEVRSQVGAETAALAAEMVDANESPSALDMLSEMLVERGASVTPAVIQEFATLAADLGTGLGTADRLRG
jgi:hypothetical protein